MGITFSGLSSGLPVDDIITKLMNVERRPLDLLAQKKTSVNAQNAQFLSLKDRVSTLLGDLKKLTSQSILDADLFETKATSSTNDSIVTASADETASPQTFTVEVLNLATSTKAASVSGVGQLVTGATDVSDVAQGTISSGNFSVFVDGVLTTVSVNKDTDTVNDVLGRISAIAGITGASVNGSGNIVVTFAGGTNVQLGANGDTSNFLNNTHLKTGTNNGTSITSALALSAINLSQNVENAAANLQTAITAGSTFKIGTASFTTTGKTLSELISDINNDADAGVTANYNVVTNKLELTSKSTGSSLITLADTSGNFLTAMGLISAGDTTVSQTVGENASFELNGSQLYSASNNVDEGITGLTGITLNLQSEDVGTEVTLSVTRDTAELKEQVKSFIDSFNKVIAYIDTNTDAKSKSALLAGEGSVRRLRSSLRSTVSNLVSGITSFGSLSQVGISTGAVGAGVSNQLQFNESKFDDALTNNPEDLKALMVGTNGIMTQLETLVDDSLNDDPDPTKDGLFAAHANSVQSRIKSIDDSISRGQARLDAKEQLLRKQFSTMEQLISQFQSQGSSISNLSAQLAANK